MTVRRGRASSACAALALLAILPPALAAAQGDAAPGKVLPIGGKVLDIEGVSLGIDAALRDLGAKVTQHEIRIELAADVLFDFDRAELRPDALASLRKLAAVVAAHPGRPVRIDGHTDAKGADDYNRSLSEQRARSVEAWLTGPGGIDGGRIRTRGLGETQPKAPNTKPDGSDDPTGRQQNRRVEIVIETG